MPAILPARLHVAREWTECGDGIAELRDMAAADLADYCEIAVSESTEDWPDLRAADLVELAGWLQRHEPAEAYDEHADHEAASEDMAMRRWAAVGY